MAGQYEVVSEPLDPSQAVGQINLVTEDGEPFAGSGGESGPVKWADIEGKPSIPAAATVDNLGGAGTVGKTVMKAGDAAAARTAIGAGTSNLKVGTAATDAKAGNWKPTATDVGAPTQEQFDALAARVSALEAAAE